MKTDVIYSGRPDGLAFISEVPTPDELTPLPLRLDLANHSPTGFAWGYHGSGPAQLALAILAEFAGPHRALAFYQDFKVDVVSTWPMDRPWRITGEQIIAWFARRGRHP
jgi:hypothetical protein